MQKRKKPILRHGDQLRRGLFGRRSGKSLNDRQARAFANLLPRLKLDLSKPFPTDLTELFGDDVEAVWIESGFGGGEHLVYRALEAPKAGFIGIEPFKNGMAKALTLIEEHNIRTIRLWPDEAAPVLDWLPDQSIDGFYLLYPDPWPKKRHWKRRFFSAANLDRITRILKPGGELRFATDIPSYIEWALEVADAHPAFRTLTPDERSGHAPWAGWPGTRYEEKARREGRTPHYFTFYRI